MRDWSSLPDEIFIMIFDKLILLIDKLRAVAVCKGWNIPFQQKPAVTDSECPLKRQYNRHKTGSQNQLSCQFVVEEPDNSNRYCVTKIINFPSDEKGAQIVGSYNRFTTDYRFGWLLDGVRMRWNKLEGNTKEPSEFMSFFFYHPFDDSYSPKFLPPLYLHPKLFGFSRKLATFSSHPTSPDCVVFLVAHLPNNEIEINTWRNGQHTWNRHLIKGLDSYIENILHVDGFLYRVTNSGSLVKFNSSNGAWEVTSPSIQGPFNHIRTPKLAELDGELLLFCWLSLIVYKHNVSSNTWVGKFRLYKPAFCFQICRDTFLNLKSHEDQGLRRADQYQNKWVVLRFCPLSV